MARALSELSAGFDLLVAVAELSGPVLRRTLLMGRDWLPPSSAWPVGEKPSRRPTRVLVSGHLISGGIRGRSGKGSSGAAPFLDDVDPELAEELKRELDGRGQRALADTIFDLRLVEPCRCTDSRCASFYTVGRFHLAWLWRQRWRTVAIRTQPLLSIDVSGDFIVGVEVAERPALRQALRPGSDR